jgi:hypothetical protein
MGSYGKNRFFLSPSQGTNGDNTVVPTVDRPSQKTSFDTSLESRKVEEKKI